MNIEVDQDAYARLERARHGTETLSDVIKRYVPPHRSLDEILRLMRKASISKETLNAIDESASRRRRAPHRRKT
jgi:predicted CopG family antitoxin